jgi:hypothetical protein
MNGEAGYLIQRATTQLEFAQKATMHEVAAIHLELSSRYLARAQMLIDSERHEDRRDNVVSIRR